MVAVKPDDLSSIPRTCVWKERTDLHSCLLTCNVYYGTHNTHGEKEFLVKMNFGWLNIHPSVQGTET